MVQGSVRQWPSLCSLSPLAGNRFGLIDTRATPVLLSCNIVAGICAIAQFQFKPARHPGLFKISAGPLRKPKASGPPFHSSAKVMPSKLSPSSINTRFPASVGIDEKQAQPKAVPQFNAA
jgi:hypothetical protein